MVRIAIALFLFVSLCSCQEGTVQPSNSDSVTPMPQFVRDMLSRLAEGKRDFRDEESREYQELPHTESQSGELRWKKTRLAFGFKLIINCKYLTVNNHPDTCSSISSFCPVPPKSLP